MPSSGPHRTSLAYRASRRILGLACCILLMASASYAQAATPASKLAFDEVGQTVAVASAATYTAFVDGATTGTVLTVTCVAGTPATTTTCTAPLLALTPGTHTVTVTQTISGAVSPPSTPLSFTYVVVVTPTNVRISGA